MNLLITVVTHNRLESTKKTLESIFETVSQPYFLVVVDNASTDGTVEWLKAKGETGYIDKVILNKKNYYPGKALNQGFEAGLKKYPADYLIRCDNDFEFYEGWDKFEKYFKAYPKLGLLGLDWSMIKDAPKDKDFSWLPWGWDGPAVKGKTRKRRNGVEMLFWPGFVGGLAVISRKVWDSGIRYSENEWYEAEGDFVPPQEDSLFSLAVMDHGFELGHVMEKVAITTGDMKHWGEDPEYYAKALKKRGYQKLFPAEIAKISAHKLLICLVTYNRLDFTKRTLKSLLKTVKQPYYLIVVDNNSTDGTQEWLDKLVEEKTIDEVRFFPRNYYPGKATNLGWEWGLASFDADFLMRVDNDMNFYPGWSGKWQKYFDRINNLGQLGLDWSLASEAPHDMILDWQPLSLDDENYRTPTRVKTKGLKLIPWPGSIGGTNIIRREVWDKGIRYDETPWPEMYDKHKTDRIVPQEDARFSTAILRAGYTFAHAGEKLAIHFGGASAAAKKYPKYYEKTKAERGIK